MVYISLFPTAPDACLLYVPGTRQTWLDDGFEPTQETGTLVQDCGPPAHFPPFPLSSPPPGGTQ